MMYACKRSGCICACRTESPGTIFKQGCLEQQKPEWHAESDIHACNDCGQTYPQCTAEPNDIIFGTGPGLDNVVFCRQHVLEGEL